MSSQKVLFASTALFFSTALLTSFEPLSLASKSDVDSPLTKEQLSLVKKGKNQAKSGNKRKKVSGGPFEAALATATDVNQCLAIADATSSYGAALGDDRRACLNKAMQLSKSPDDYFAIALKARQYELFEITKAAIDALTARAETNEQLYDLARKAHQIALNDVAHAALQKAYNHAKTEAEAINFARQAKLLAVQDLERQAIIDLIQDQTNTTDLLELLREIEPLQEADLNRKLLKKSLDFMTTPDECKLVFDKARDMNQRDISALAAYRGRRMVLLKQLAEDKAAYEQQLQQWKAGRLDAQEQQAANDLAKQRGPNANEPGF
jgi:hypothetical protein